MSAPLDRVWLDFRDTFGAAWALRLGDRLNTAAGRLGWNVRLRWNGVSTTDGEPPSDKVMRGTERCLRGMLRRFVSDEWIAARMNST